MAKTRVIELSTRPLRYAFIVGAKPTRKEILSVIRHCCQTFGGANSVIVPSNGASFDEFWRRFLLASDPDVIALIGDFGDPTNIKRQIADLDIQPFGVRRGIGEFSSVVDRYGSLPMDRVYMAKAVEEMHRGQGRRMKVAANQKWSETTNFYEWFHFGALSKSFTKKHNHIIEFVNPKRVANLEANDYTDPLALTTEYMNCDSLEYYSATYDDSVLGPHVVVVGNRNSFADCCGIGERYRVGGTMCTGLILTQ